MTHTDEVLKSYLDGTLPETEAEALEEAMSTDEALQKLSLIHI